MNKRVLGDLLVEGPKSKRLHRESKVRLGESRGTFDSDGGLFTGRRVKRSGLAQALRRAKV